MPSGYGAGNLLDHLREQITLLADERNQARDRAGDLSEEIERLKDAGKKLQEALTLIDIQCMSNEQIEDDTEAVGGPVPPYTTEYDESDVVARVTLKMARLENDAAGIATRALFDKSHAAGVQKGLELAAKWLGGGGRENELIYRGRAAEIIRSLQQQAKPRSSSFSADFMNSVEIMTNVDGAEIDCQKDAKEQK